jgi:hypothetical protein
LIGNTPLASHLHRTKEATLEKLRLHYEHRVDLWIDSLDTRKLFTAESDTQESTSSSHSFISSLRKLIDEDMLSSINLTDAIHEDLDKLTRALPGELNNIFEPELANSHSDAAEKLKREGTHWILHQLNTESDGSSTDDAT